MWYRPRLFQYRQSLGCCRVVRQDEWCVRIGSAIAGVAQGTGKWGTTEPTGSAAGPLDGLWPRLGCDGMPGLSPRATACPCSSPPLALHHLRLTKEHASVHRAATEAVT
jgi:hypothetical protein